MANKKHIRNGRQNSIILEILSVLRTIIFFHDLGNEPVQDELRLSDCYCFAYKTLLMQGWSKTPDSYQNRIAFVCIMIAGMLLYWHWEAMVISYLAVKKVVLPYTSFEQLLSVSSDKVRKHYILSCIN